MIWPVWIGAALAVAGLAQWRENDPRPALAIALGLVATRLVSAATNGPTYLMACFTLWVCVGAVIVVKYRSAATGSLIVCSGLCYLAARVSHAPVAIGSPVFVISDALGCAALCVSAWSGFDGGKRRLDLGRGGLLDRWVYRRGAGALAGIRDVAKGAG